VSFSTSQSDAIAAAMTYLKKPLESQIVVTTVYGGSPSDGVLQPKDELVAIDGKQITDPAQVAEAIRSAPIGTAFELTISRGGTEQKVSVTSAPNPQDATVPYIGIGVGVYYSAGFPIDFTLNDVGGPSAGLMFATGIVDKLSPDDLTKGQHIAGTGTISPDGTVGAIGGIRQKMAGARNDGATLFLMPEVHCDEASGYIPDGLTVVPVTTLTDAIDAIHAYTAGQPVATCPAKVS
jgi:PDZ domain-containing protein